MTRPQKYIPPLDPLVITTCQMADLIDKCTQECAWAGNFWFGRRVLGCYAVKQDTKVSSKNIIGYAATAAKSLFDRSTARQAPNTDPSEQPD
jgi:hypothetical protein